MPSKKCWLEKTSRTFGGAISGRIERSENRTQLHAQYSLWLLIRHLGGYSYRYSIHYFNYVLCTTKVLIPTPIAIGPLLQVNYWSMVLVKVTNAKTDVSFISYRKVEVYSLLWKQIELSKFIIAGAQYGGPIGT